MNIKSLLLGSAAALVAVSGARAADAVVMVEPEPAEYVRICDTYGTGFFYIPGTETCLKIGGYLRARINFESEAVSNDLDDDSIDGDDVAFGTRVRARLDFDAREETELGTLRAKVRVQATNRGNGSGTGDSPYGMDEGFLQLGGLTIGYLDTLWTEDDGLLLDTDWAAGDFQQNRVSYTFAVAGFTATISGEDDGTGDAIPDVVAQLKYEGGFGSAYLTGVYDEDTDFDVIGGTGFFFDDFDVSDNEDGAFALKAGVSLKDLLVAGSVFKVEGHYAFDPTEYATVGNLLQNETNNAVFFGGDFGLAQSVVTGALPSEFQIGAAYQQTFNKLTVAVNGIYGETFDLAATNGVDTFEVDGGEYYGLGLNVGYDITSNFSVLGEVTYRDVSFDSSINGVDLDDDFDQTAGFIEFKRTF